MLRDRAPHTEVARRGGRYLRFSRSPVPSAVTAIGPRAPVSVARPRRPARDLPGRCDRSHRWSEGTDTRTRISLACRLDCRRSGTAQYPVRRLERFIGGGGGLLAVTPAARRGMRCRETAGGRTPRCAHSGDRAGNRCEQRQQRHRHDTTEAFSLHIGLGVACGGAAIERDDHRRHRSSVASGAHEFPFFARISSGTPARVVTSKYGQQEITVQSRQGNNCDLGHSTSTAP
jgi:hypothetical protein